MRRITEDQNSMRHLARARWDHHNYRRERREAHIRALCIAFCACATVAGAAMLVAGHLEYRDGHGPVAALEAGMHR